MVSGSTFLLPLVATFVTHETPRQTRVVPVLPLSPVLQATPSGNKNDHPPEENTNPFQTLHNVVHRVNELGQKVAQTHRLVFRDWFEDLLQASENPTFPFPTSEYLPKEVQQTLVEYHKQVQAWTNQWTHLSLEEYEKYGNPRALDEPNSYGVTNVLRLVVPVSSKIQQAYEALEETPGRMEEQIIAYLMNDAFFFRRLPNFEGQDILESLSSSEIIQLWGCAQMQLRFPTSFDDQLASELGWDPRTFMTKLVQQAKKEQE